MNWVPGMYFRDPDEACAWLSFDAQGQEVEQAFYADNDRFHEWLQWRMAWRVYA